MPLTPASKRKILLIIAKNAKRGGRGAVIKYVKRASKGKPGRPLTARPDIRLAEEVKRRIDGRPRYIRKACMLLAEEIGAEWAAISPSSSWPISCAATTASSCVCSQKIFWAKISA